MSAEPARAAAPILDELRRPDVSLLDTLDHVLDKGCVVSGQLVLGLAGVELVVIDLALVLGDADRLSDPPSAKPR